MLLTDALTQYVQIRLVGGSPKTKQRMETAIGWYGEFLNRAPSISDLTDVGISDFGRWRLEEGKARDTVNQNQSKLLALWRFLADDNIVARRPKVRPVACAEKVPKAWTEEELIKLYAALRTTEGMVGPVPAALWWEALHNVLWNTGERIEAIFSCKWADLDISGCHLYVRAQYRKCAKREIMFKLLPETVRQIEQFPLRKGVILHWPQSRSMLYRKYTRILERAGLPSGRDSKFHRIRKSVASHIKAAGGDATAAMDHSSSAVTRAYIDLRICPPPRPCELLFKIA